MMKIFFLNYFHFLKLPIFNIETVGGGAVVVDDVMLTLTKVGLIAEGALVVTVVLTIFVFSSFSSE